MQTARYLPTRCIDVVRTRTIVGLLAATAMSSGGRAAAQEERWLLSAEGSLAHAITNPQRDLFGPGATGSAAVLRSMSSWFLLGLRAQALVLSNKSSPPEDETLAEPDTGGLYVLSPVVRLRPLGTLDRARRATGLFLEGGGGPGLTGSRVRPSIHGAIGYGFDVAGVVVSPSARFVQVVQTSGPSQDDARFAALGIEVTFFDDEPPPAPRLHTVEPIVIQTEAPEEPEPKTEEVAKALVDTDGDGILDEADDCPTEPETLNGINDDDGCPDTGSMEPVNGRVIVDDAVLFETGRVRLNSEGRALIKELAQRWKADPDWVGLRVEGHADVRGSRAYNMKLSKRRAKNVRRALIRFGVQPGAVRTVGFGENRPVDRGRSDEAHRKNRRVEFVVVKRQKSAASTQEMSK